MASRSALEQIINKALLPFRVEIRFSRQAKDDLASYKKEQQEIILAELIRRAKNGPLIKPDGLGEPLHGDLVGFAKIKPKRLGLRIIYRPVDKTGKIIMEVIAIGPRDKKKVYELAARRVLAFQAEMSK